MDLRSVQRSCLHGCPDGISESPAFVSLDFPPLHPFRVFLQPALLMNSDTSRLSGQGVISSNCSIGLHLLLTEPGGSLRTVENARTR